MTKLAPELAAQVLLACQTGCGEIAAALSRTFATEFELHLGEPAPLASEDLAEELASAGLTVTLRVAQQALAIVLPESCGLIPAWYAQPDATGRSKLTTLAQELSMLLLPETLSVDEFHAGRSVDLRQWLSRGEATDDAMRLPLALSDAAGRQGVAHVIWPLNNPAALLAMEEVEAAIAAPASPVRQSPAQAAARRIPAVAAKVAQRGEEELPSYSRSLLRISVPVTVTLAEKRQSVSRIVELGPGAIIQFDKSCEELLELEIDGHKIGMGEAVKVGDKFGLRITSMIVPEERYVPVRRAAT